MQQRKAPARVRSASAAVQKTSCASSASRTQASNVQVPVQSASAGESASASRQSAGFRPFAVFEAVGWDPGLRTGDKKVDQLLPTVWLAVGFWLSPITLSPKNRVQVLRNKMLPPIDTFITSSETSLIRLRWSIPGTCRVVQSCFHARFQ